jgi:hypothetical protein
VIVNSRYFVIVRQTITTDGQKAKGPVLTGKIAKICSLQPICVPVKKRFFLTCKLVSCRLEASLTMVVKMSLVDTPPGHKAGAGSCPRRTEARPDDHKRSPGASSSVKLQGRKAACNMWAFPFVSETPGTFLLFFKGLCARRSALRTFGTWKAEHMAIGQAIQLH